MKLEELKVALIQQFFKSCDNGVSRDVADGALESLSKMLDSDIEHLSEGEEPEEMHSGNSGEPSKAFRKFVGGRKATLTINEDDGGKTKFLFAAVRSGTDVAYCDLTKEPREERKGDLLSIKHALRQAKNMNADIYFNIKNDEQR